MPETVFASAMVIQPISDLHVTRADRAGAGGDVRPSISNGDQPFMCLCVSLEHVFGMVIYLFVYTLNLVRIQLFRFEKISCPS
jgi:hypothetical protein